MTHNARGETSGYFFPMSTDPPLVHFTTADLGNLADGKYKLTEVASRLHTLGAAVVITPEHLTEWVPLASASRESRFSLADQLNCTFIDLPSADIWQPASCALTLRSACAQCRERGSSEPQARWDRGNHKQIREVRQPGPHNQRIGQADFGSPPTRRDQCSGRQLTAEGTHAEQTFEAPIKRRLVEHSGLGTAMSFAFGRSRDIIPDILVAFSKATQYEAWSRPLP